MKTILFVFLYSLLLPSHAESSSNQDLTAILKTDPCQIQAKAVLEGWKSKDEWSTLLGNGKAKISQPDAFHSPTQTLGAWVQIEAPKGKGLMVSRITDRLYIKVEFDPVSCEHRTQFFKKLQTSCTSQCLDDFKLKKLLASHPNSIVGIWSPHMPYSVLALKTLMKIAQEQKLHFLPLLDPNASIKAAKAITKREEWSEEFLRKNLSFELSQRGLGIHYPSVQLFKNSIPQGKPFYGLAGRTQYLAYLNETLQ